MSERSISESGRWDRRRSSARFLAVSWFVEFRFVAGGDDADDFCGFLIVIGVDDRERDDGFDETGGVPFGIAPAGGITMPLHWYRGPSIYVGATD